MVRVGLGLIAVVCPVIGLAGLAGAADLPAEGAHLPPPPVFLYDWSGFYIGAHAGGGWGRKHWVDTTLAPLDEGSHDVTGALAGGQIGFNFQAGSWVFGVEGQASWADLTGEHISLAFPTDRDRTRVDALGTVAGRARLRLRPGLALRQGRRRLGARQILDHRHPVRHHLCQLRSNALGLDGGRRPGIRHNRQLVGEDRIQLHGPRDGAGDATLSAARISAAAAPAARSTRMSASSSTW